MNAVELTQVLDSERLGHHLLGALCQLLLGIPVVLSMEGILILYYKIIEKIRQF